MDKSKTAKPGNAWWQSEAATTAKATELGFGARPGESWADFRQRIRDAITALQHPPHARDQDPEQGHVIKAKKGKFGDEQEPPPST